MQFTPIINKNEIASNIAYQYSESTNFIDYLSILVTPFDELESVYADILNKRLFDTANHHGLDVLGNLVGQSRGAYDTTLFPFFGFKEEGGFDPTNILGFGDLNDESIGGILRSLEQPETTIVALSDEEFKELIIGRQHLNNFKGGTESLIEAIKEIYRFEGTGNFEVRDNFSNPLDPFVEIELFQQLSKAEESYLTTLDILPKPGGIRYEYIFV